MPLDWLAALDLDRAAANLRTESVGDWHQDPWGWPEIDFAIKDQPELFLDSCNETGARIPALVSVPKENWGVRPAVVLDSMNRLTYQALVDRFSVDLIGDMNPNAFGWRLPPTDPKRGVYTTNNHQWDSYLGHLKTCSAWSPAALRTDLVSFFASIPAVQAQAAIEERTPKSQLTTRLLDFIEGFQQTVGRGGLPQRSLASCVIANMYVNPIDDALAHHAKAMPILFMSPVQYRLFGRWMDDMWLFGSDAAAMRKAQMALQSVAEDLGLNLNAAKTEVLEGDDVEEQIAQIEHSGIDDAIEAKNFTPLEELVDGLLATPERAGRTSMKFASKRMRDNGLSYRAQDLVQAAERMPHVADTLSRLFKTLFTAPSLEDWFVDYVNSDWASHEWAIAHFARMFPADYKPHNPSLHEYFAARIRDANVSLPLLAVAAQRLAAWDPVEARTACRDAISSASNPHSEVFSPAAALH